MADADQTPGGGANGAGRKASLPKRFYAEVSTREEGVGSIVLLLDGKPVRTPGKAILAVPTKALAEAIASEWRGQGERVDPETMPLTRLANSVIDGVKGREEAVIDDILGYAGSDLVCYRADGPDGLIAKQSAHWDKIIDWARRDLGAKMRLAEGVMHVPQDPGAIGALRERLVGFDAWGLAALHVMTGLTGSALLALATALGHLSPEAAWEAAHVDEDWQVSQWGEDEEAVERRVRRHRDFTTAARMLTLLS